LFYGSLCQGLLFVVCIDNQLITTLESLFLFQFIRQCKSVYTSVCTPLERCVSSKQWQRSYTRSRLRKHC